MNVLFSKSHEQVRVFACSRTIARKVIKGFLQNFAVSFNDGWGITHTLPHYLRITGITNHYLRELSAGAIHKRYQKNSPHTSSNSNRGFLNKPSFGMGGVRMSPCPSHEAGDESATIYRRNNT